VDRIDPPEGGVLPDVEAELALRLVADLDHGGDGARGLLGAAVALGGLTPAFFKVFTSLGFGFAVEDLRSRWACACSWS
jgi:hypothetical protein